MLQSSLGNIESCSSVRLTLSWKRSPKPMADLGFFKGLVASLMCVVLIAYDLKPGLDPDCDMTG